MRLIVRRVKPTPGSQLALFVNYSYHAFISDRAGELLELEAGHRRHAEVENAIRDPQVRRRAEPSPLGPLRRERGVARGAGDRAQPRPLDGAPRARRGNRDDQDAQAALLRSRRTAHPFCPALDPAPPEALALGWPVGSRAGAVTGATAPGLTPAHSAGPAPRLAPACPRTPRAPSRRRPQRPRAALSDAERRLLAPAPPGERRRTRRTLRQPGSPPRQASIGGFGVKALRQGRGRRGCSAPAPLLDRRGGRDRPGPRDLRSFTDWS